jgi:hypothetical protein
MEESVAEQDTGRDMVTAIGELTARPEQCKGPKPEQVQEVTGEKVRVVRSQR